MSDTGGTASAPTVGLPEMKEAAARPGASPPLREERAESRRPSDDLWWAEVSLRAEPLAAGKRAPHCPSLLRASCFGLAGDTGTLDYSSGLQNCCCPHKSSYTVHELTLHVHATSFLMQKY